MKLILIASVAEHGAIGRAGDLAFHLRADLRHFKELTMGSPVIMGRKTFQSLPKGALPGRRNIVITRDASFTAPDIETVPSIDAALALAGDAPQAFIIGGGSIYAATIDRADALEITHIDAVCPDADTFFPTIDPERWRLAASTPAETDPNTGVNYTFATYLPR